MFAGGATKSAGLYHRSTVGLSSCPDPIRFGQLGAPLLTPVCIKTVNGRPVVIVAMPGELPAAGDRAEHARRRQPPAARPQRQLPDTAHHGAMAHVEAGGTVPGVEVGDCLWVADRAAAACRRAAVIERLAVGVAAQELQPIVKRCVTLS